MRKPSVSSCLLVLGAALLGCSSTAPGASVSAQDTPHDAGDAGLDSDVTETGDSAEATDAGPCVLEESSTLPHVHVVFGDAGCTFTAAQAKAGVTIAYSLVVDEAVADFSPGGPYYYEEDVAANLYVRAILSGGGQQYCLCDRGLPEPFCPDSSVGFNGPAPTNCPTVTLPAGTYPRTFVWDGRNWGGPSDTATPEGPPFPPGDYELRVTTAAGSLPGVASASVLGRLRVHLVP